MKSSNLIRTSAMILTLGWAGAASAGGWIGGGGELLEDSMNPWFVQAGQYEAAAHIVRYCIETDEANFGVPMRSLEGQVRSAFDYWVDEFASSMTAINGPGTRNVVLVAKEVFVPVPTCANAQIRFQFGVLTPEQLTEFHTKDLDPKRFVALAARTSYDETTLQSKGFIYFAPPRGPLAMSTPDMKEDPWAADSQIRLSAVIRHELGHVFGIQHTGTHGDLMGGGFPEFAISTASYPYVTHGIFKLPSGTWLNKRCYSERQGMPAFLVQYFSIPAGDLCVGFKVHPDRVDVVSSSDSDHQPRVIGSAQLDRREMIIRADPLVRVWLTETQNVFLDVPSNLGRLLAGPMVMRRQATATMISGTGGPNRSLQISLAPEELRVGGIWEDQIILDVFQHADLGRR